MTTYLRHISLTYKEVNTATKIKRAGNFSEFVRSCLNDKTVVKKYLKKCREEDLEWSKEQRRKESKNLKGK